MSSFGGSQQSLETSIRREGLGRPENSESDIESVASGSSNGSVGTVEQVKTWLVNVRRLKDPASAQDFDKEVGGMLTKQSSSLRSSFRSFLDKFKLAFELSKIRSLNDSDILHILKALKTLFPKSKHVRFLPDEKLSRNSSTTSRSTVSDLPWPASSVSALRNSTEHTLLFKLAPVAGTDDKAVEIFPAFGQLGSHEATGIMARWKSRHIKSRLGKARFEFFWCSNRCMDTAFESIWASGVASNSVRSCEIDLSNELLFDSVLNPDSTVGLTYITRRSPKSKSLERVLRSVAQYSESDITVDGKSVINLILSNFMSLISDDIVSAVCKYQETQVSLRRVLSRLRIRLDPETISLIQKDLQILAQSLEDHLRDDARYKAFVRISGHKAQHMLDFLHDLLSDFSLELSAQLRATLTKALIRLSDKSARYPCSLFLNAIDLNGKSSEAGGSYSEVFHTKLGSEDVSVKSLKIYERSNLKKLTKAFLKEGLVWAHMSHPNILPLYGMYWDDKSPRMGFISPWMKNGNVVRYLETSFSADKYLMALGIARGVEYLHNGNTVHGDLKGANILVSDDGRPCLADFGLSAIVEQRTRALSSVSTLPGGGTLVYTAPELLMSSDNCKISSATDIYSFGMVLYEIFSGHEPYHSLRNNFHVMREICDGHLPHKEIIPDAIWRLIGLCCQMDANMRPTAIQARDYLEQLVRPQALIDSSLLCPWDQSHITEVRRNYWRLPRSPTFSDMKELV